MSSAAVYVLHASQSCLMLSQLCWLLLVVAAPEHLARWQTSAS